MRNGRVSAIIGLDRKFSDFFLYLQVCISISYFSAAGPLFSVGNPAGRLDAGDAVYVEAIHTNGPTLLIAGM